MGLGLDSPVPPLEESGCTASPRTAPRVRPLQRSVAARAPLGLASLLQRGSH
jgi:hypothetical protein